MYKNQVLVIESQHLFKKREGSRHSNIDQIKHLYIKKITLLLQKCVLLIPPEIPQICQFSIFRQNTVQIIRFALYLDRQTTPVCEIGIFSFYWPGGQWP